MESFPDEGRDDIRHLFPHILNLAVTQVPTSLRFFDPHDRFDGKIRSLSNSLKTSVRGTVVWKDRVDRIFKFS